MGNPKNNKAMTAAAMVLANTHTQAEAARHVGVSRQAVHRALERIRKREAAIPVDFAPGEHPARHGAS